jgi:hypothetical protein
MIKLLLRDQTKHYGSLGGHMTHIFLFRFQLFSHRRVCTPKIRLSRIQRYQGGREKEEEEKVSLFMLATTFATKYVQHHLCGA